MSFPLTVLQIAATDTLNTGFREKANNNFSNQITNLEITEDLKLRVTFQSTLTANVDLSQYIYSKSQVNGSLSVPIATEEVLGKIAIATLEDTLAGLNDTKAITPNKLTEFFASILSRSFPAGEALAAGDLVNVYLDGTVAKARKAVSVDTSRFAYGFVKSNVAAGASATVYTWGTIPNQTGLIPGQPYYLSDTTPGRIVGSSPTSNYSQTVGVAVSSESLWFNAGPLNMREEPKAVFVPITTDGQLTFLVPGMANKKVSRVWLKQPDVSDAFEPTKWSYEPTTGILTLDASLAPRIHSGHQLMIDTALYGTAGAGYGLQMMRSGDDLYWKYKNEPDSAYQLLGTVPSDSGSETVRRPEYHEVNTKAGALALATGDIPLQIRIADVGTAPTPLPVMAFYRPGYPGQLEYVPIVTLP